MGALELTGYDLDIASLQKFSRAALDPKARLVAKFSKSALENVQKASSFVDAIVGAGKPVYGINTGFGKFADVSIATDQLEQLQKNLILSHACGYGEPLPRNLVASMWALRLNTIARGHGGVRKSTLDAALKLLEANVLAVVPSRGSVGASGDLAPSAHMVLPLLGEGFVSRPRQDGFEIVPSLDALKDLGLSPLKLGPKEGLSLINGTQLTTGLVAAVSERAENLLRHANLALALTIESLRASHGVIDPMILKARNQPGAVTCGVAVADWLQGATEISRSHANCGRVQDPYSVRCAPQVHGCVHDEIEAANLVVRRELNASTDNPLLFPDEGRSVSGGNFHAIYTARAADTLAASLAVLASISERRIALAMSPGSSGHPAFLIADGGLNSGFMMAQVTAAALVSEAKTLSHPASVDSIPTSDDKEDHVSMGPIAGLKALHITDLVRGVLAVEILAGLQGLHLLSPLKSSPRLTRVVALLRQHVAPLTHDRILANDIEAVSRLIDEGVLLSV